MSNLTPEKRLNKNGVAVIKYVRSATDGAALKKIPAPAAVPSAPAEDSEQRVFSPDDMRELSDIISESTEDERSYHYMFLNKGDLDGLRLLHANAHDPSTTYEIMNTLNDLGLSTPDESFEQRQASIALHTPFYEAGLIDYAAYGADGGRNEDLVKLVDEYASHSVRVMELMLKENDLRLAEELRPYLKMMASGRGNQNK